MWGSRFVLGLLVTVLLLAVALELRTSYAQAAVFTRIAATFGYELAEGPSDLIRFPRGGPYDKRLGYAGIPRLAQHLDSLGFDITHQARLSPSLARWVDRGVYPIYAPRGTAGLRLYDRRGDVLVDEQFPRYGYRSFEDVPELVWATLIHIESQGMLAGGPRRNPAVEWDRLALGAVSLALRGIGAERSVPGGSTLATQIEKYRHSPDGITHSPREKARQMLSASLRAYAGGPETSAQRYRIVTDYLNSVPLAGQAGHGEVMGLAEGLEAWYGTPFERASIVLNATPTGPLEQLEQAIVYRQVLSLLVAQRRPSYYLASHEGRQSLKRLTDAYLRLLERDGVIPGWLASDARRLGSLRIRDRALTSEGERSALVVSGTGSALASLLEVTRAPGIHELRRMDAVASTTLDAIWSEKTQELLSSMGSRDFLKTEGLLGRGLLGEGDPSHVYYSVLLMERTDLGNAVRIQADNYPGAMSLADASRLELGSTAKLRTLVTYLEVVEEIHRRLAPLDPEVWHEMDRPGQDPITRWVARELITMPDATLSTVLGAALDRRYSASPRERFATGGSYLTFSNFDDQFDARVLSVREAFRHSVNLPFVRLMRDLVEYEIGRLGTADLLSRRDDPRRAEYLVKFAEHEAAQYIRRFHAKYRNRSGHEVFEGLLSDRRLSPTQAAWAIRAIAPDIGLRAFEDVLRAYGPDLGPTSDEPVAALYARAEPRTLPLSDLGHLARVHPLELWVASHRLYSPSATLDDLLRDGRATTLDVYGWLLRTSRADAQDARIRSVLEIEAFQRIHTRWRRLGYPFDDLAPSLGTAIGSSGDRPLALAELVGIIQNDGVRLPVVRVPTLTLGEGTPYETRFGRRPPKGERVMRSEVASVLEQALLDVVESGTGRRASGALLGDGAPLAIGGKTGTGDNRYRIHDARGRFVASRVVNRTATFVFVAGDRWFGVVTAYVAGPSAEDHAFTSALPTQVLRALGARLGSLESLPVDAVLPSIPARLANGTQEKRAQAEQLAQLGDESVRPEVLTGGRMGRARQATRSR